MTGKGILVLWVDLIVMKGQELPPTSLVVCTGDNTMNDATSKHNAKITRWY